MSHPGGHEHCHGQDPPADVAWDAAFWDERYRSSSALWSGQPNPQLVIEAGDLRPGTALDVGCGEGADAIWLATRGWRVTAVDISTVALERGAAQAGAVGDDVGLRISWLQADLIEWNPPASYDLVSAQFMHLPKAQRQASLQCSSPPSTCSSTLSACQATDVRSRLISSGSAVSASTLA